MTLPYVKTSPTSADAALRAEPRAGTDRALLTTASEIRRLSPTKDAAPELPTVPRRVANSSELRVLGKSRTASGGRTGAR